MPLRGFPRLFLLILHTVVFFKINRGSRLSHWLYSRIFSLFWFLSTNTVGSLSQVLYRNIFSQRHEKARCKMQSRIMPCRSITSCPRFINIFSRENNTAKLPKEKNWEWFVICWTNAFKICVLSFDSINRTASFIVSSLFFKRLSNNRSKSIFIINRPSMFIFKETTVSLLYNLKEKSRNFLNKWEKWLKWAVMFRQMCSFSSNKQTIFLLLKTVLFLWMLIFPIIFEVRVVTDCPE